MSNNGGIQPPIKNDEPTAQVKDSLLKSTYEKLSLSDGDVLVVRLSAEYRKKMNPQQASWWVRAAIKNMRSILSNIGKKNEVIFLDEGVKLEKIPLEDLKKIVKQAEGQGS